MLGPCSFSWLTPPQVTGVGDFTKINIPGGDSSVQFFHVDSSSDRFFFTAEANWVSFDALYLLFLTSSPPQTPTVPTVTGTLVRVHACAQGKSIDEISFQSEAWSSETASARGFSTTNGRASSPTPSSASVPVSGPTPRRTASTSTTSWAASGTCPATTTPMSSKTA